MSFLSNVMRAVVNPATIAQLAMGPAGWASLATRVIASAVGQQVIQQLGQKLGLPQGIINLAQNAFTAATGTQGFPNTISGAVSYLSGQMNLSPSQSGELARVAERAYDPINSLVERMARKAGEEEGTAYSGATGGKGGSVLMRIAQALGKLMDDKMNAMAAKGDQLGRLGNNGALTKDGNFNAAGQSQYGKLSAEMGALGQELSLLSNALNNSLKSIGEAAAKLASKN